MNIFLSTLLIYFNFSIFTLNNDQNESPDLNVLVGTWELDMSPENTSDANFAMMEITKVTNNSLEGFFYREGVEIQEGRINTQTGIIYAALISGDNSGQYNTAFYYQRWYSLWDNTFSFQRFSCCLDSYQIRLNTLINSLC